VKKEIYQRINGLSERLNKKDIDVALIMQNIDLFYYSGTIPSAVLAISKDNKLLYAIKRGYLRAKDESFIDADDMVQFKGLSALPALLAERDIKFKKIGIEMDVMPVEMFNRLRKYFKNSEFVDISFDVRWQRSIKSEYEIELMKQAARMLDCTMEDAKELLQSGKKEIEISAELEYRARKRGHQGKCGMRAFNGEVFMGHVHSGAQSASPSGFLKPTAGIGLSASYPEGASDKKIKKNEPIIVDFLGNYKGYMSDETRIFADGKLKEECESAYNFCRSVLEWMEEYAKPGVIAEDIYNKSLEMAAKEGYKDNFMGIKTNQTPFVGHGIGLELDEFPFIARGQNYALCENMTFAFEPKVAFKDRGAVGIENTYVVRKNGVEPLTRFHREIVYL